jgi:hypothetical protein
MPMKLTLLITSFALSLSVSAGAVKRGTIVLDGQSQPVVFTEATASNQATIRIGRLDAQLDYTYPVGTPELYAGDVVYNRGTDALNSIGVEVWVKPSDFSNQARDAKLKDVNCTCQSTHLIIVKEISWGRVYGNCTTLR